jgi:glycosyltransferase involved in cell wall biosynthesis
MSTAPKISAFIITKNEAQRITKAIESIKDIVEEIIVVDSGSTDDTVAIATKLGAKVVHNDWPGYAQQKAFAESLCINPWVLNIDADEELSVNLKNEIAYIFASNVQDQYRGYSINFVIMHRSDTKPRCLAPSNRFIRLYNRGFASFGNSTKFSTRDAVSFNKGIDEKKSVHKLFNPAFHYSGVSLEQLVAKANFYSTEQAKDMIANKRIPSKARVYGEFFVYFFKSFFIRRYFVFGYNGFVDSLTFAFARFLRMAKTREFNDNK